MPNADDDAIPTPPIDGKLANAWLVSYDVGETIHIVAPDLPLDQLRIIASRDHTPRSIRPIHSGVAVLAGPPGSAYCGDGRRVDDQHNCVPHDANKRHPNAACPVHNGGEIVFRTDQPDALTAWHITWSDGTTWLFLVPHYHLNRPPIDSQQFIEFLRNSVGDHRPFTLKRYDTGDFPLATGPQGFRIPNGFAFNFSET